MIPQAGVSGQSNVVVVAVSVVGAVDAMGVHEGGVISAVRGSHGVGIRVALVIHGRHLHKGHGSDRVKVRAWSDRLRFVDFRGILELVLYLGVSH